MDITQEESFPELPMKSTRPAHRKVTCDTYEDSSDPETNKDYDMTIRIETPTKPSTPANLGSKLGFLASANQFLLSQEKEVNSDVQESIPPPSPEMKKNDSGQTRELMVWLNALRGETQ